MNEVYKPLFTEKPRYFILMGGRGAGRSTVASQYANAKLVAPEYFRCAIMRYVLGDIRNSIYREITDRAEENDVLDALDINESTMTIEYGANSINAVGFRKSSSDQKAKLKSLANYNCVIIEEADEIPEEDFMQLDDSLRTVKGDITVVLLLNPPPKSHWIINRWFDLIPAEVPGFFIPKLKQGMEDTVFIRTSYLDNVTNISPQIVRNYERYQDTNPDHYWNMVRGYVPETVRGLIYSGWKEVPDVPHEARLIAYGVDFGYHPDPAACVAMYYYNGGYIFDEIFYQTELLNRHIANRLLNLPKAPVICDSAEPKSIAELQEAGIDAIPTEKGADSVRFGIKKTQATRISYTARSKNIKRESDEYHWLIDKDGNVTEVPDPKCDDHLMDPIRYCSTWVTPEDPVETVRRDRKMAEHQRERRETARADAGL